MANTINVRCDAEGYWAAQTPEPWARQEDVVSVTTFYGGTERGQMVQVTIGRDYVCMTRASAMAVAQAIEFASRHDVGRYPAVFPG